MRNIKFPLPTQANVNKRGYSQDEYTTPSSNAIVLPKIDKPSGYSKGEGYSKPNQQKLRARITDSTYSKTNKI